MRLNDYGAGPPKKKEEVAPAKTRPQVSTDTLLNFQRVLQRLVRRYSNQFWNLSQLQARVDTELLRRGRTR